MSGEDEVLRQLLDRPRARTREGHDATILHAARSLKKPAWRIVIPTALAAGLAVLAFGMYVSLPPGDDDIVRSSASIDKESVSPAVGRSLQAPPPELHWPAQQGAHSYRVVLRDASGVVIWRSDLLTTNHVSLDREVAARLTPHTYYWSVEVAREEAKLELGPFWFRLVDP